MLLGGHTHTRTPSATIPSPLAKAATKVTSHIDIVDNDAAISTCIDIGVSSAG